MTSFDYFVLGIMAISMLIGSWRGVVSEILALVAWVAAFIAARAWAGQAGDLIVTDVGDDLARQVIGFLAVFVLVLVVFAFARWLLTQLLKAVGLRPLDRVLGALFGFVRGVLAVWVGVLLAGLTILPQQAWWRQALLSPSLEMAVLAARPWLPQELSKRIHYR